MRKISLLIGLSLVLLLLFGLTGRAQGASGEVQRPNLLDLSNFKRHSGNGERARTFLPIDVEANQQYTIVIDFAFLGESVNSLGELTIRVQDYPSAAIVEHLVLSDPVTMTAYFEFTPLQNKILILDMPVAPSNGDYNAVLYKGAFIDFTGYTPFIDPNEVMSYQGSLFMDVDQLMPISQIETFIHAHDPQGNPLAKSVESDNFSTSSKMPGQYQIIFSAQYNNITKNYYLNITVIDRVGPVIADPGLISVDLGSKLSIDQIKQLIVVTDNVDTILSSELVVTSDTYSTANTVGQYIVSVQATDSSGNVTTRVINIDLVDLVGPEIDGPQAIYLYTTDDALTNDEIIAYFDVLDVVDGSNVVFIFSLNNYQQTKIPGIYDINLKATDTNGNETVFYLKMHVIENRGPVFTENEVILDVATANAMTHQEIIDWFIAQTLSSGQVITNVTILFSEYEGNETKMGSYYIYFNYEVDGEIETSRITVNVENEDSFLRYLPFLATGIPLLIGGAVIYKIRKRK